MKFYTKNRNKQGACGVLTHLKNVQLVTLGQYVLFTQHVTLRCFKAHKLDNNIGLKPSQWAVEAYIIFQDNRFLNMRIRLNVAMNDPHYKL